MASPTPNRQSPIILRKRSPAGLAGRSPASGGPGGVTPEEIREVTGCTRSVLERYVADFEEGKKEGDFTPFWGIDLGPRDLCRLRGVWWANYGGK